MKEEGEGGINSVVVSQCIKCKRTIINVLKVFTDCLQCLSLHFREGEMQHCWKLRTWEGGGSGE